MPRQLLVFGNGLGRSIDNERFMLSNVMAEVWAAEDGLSVRQKELILRCLPEDVLDDVPTREDQLADLQEIVAACDRILQAEGGTGAGWLSAEGREFPAAIRSYVHRIACKFHNGRRLPEDFSLALRAHILEHRSHVATLNYDDLLYRAFLNTDVMDGFHCLIDGFSYGEFSPENLVRRFNPNRKAWYLHLHGSPLFYEPEPGRILKAPLAAIDLIEGDSSGHIVLTSVKHKISVIESSEILTSYWHHFDEAIAESEGVVLFGYGGADDHLNDRIKSKRNGRIRVVERTHDNEAERRAFWRQKIGDHELVWMENILQFAAW